jgi:hypothetical protein
MPFGCGNPLAEPGDLNEAVKVLRVAVRLLAADAADRADPAVTLFTDA